MYESSHFDVPFKSDEPSKLVVHALVAITFEPKVVGRKFFFFESSSSRWFREHKETSRIKMFIFIDFQLEEGRGVHWPQKISKNMDLRPVSLSGTWDYCENLHITP